MVDDEPTQPDLRAQQAGGAPAWPLPQPQRPAVPDSPLTGRWVLFVVVAFLLAFGAGSGLTVLLAQANGATTAPPGGSNPHVSPTHQLVPTHAPTSVPIVNPPASTATPKPTPKATSTPS